MSYLMDTYIGSIFPFAGNYAPVNFLLCQGQLLPIAEYEALFSLLGTTYGGDGVQTFALPNLTGRTPVGVSPQIPLGKPLGSNTVTLTAAQLPPHSHTANAVSDKGSISAPTGRLLADTSGTTGVANIDKDYIEAANAGTLVKMAANAVGKTGKDAPAAISVVQPSMAINFIIAVNGIYPQSA
jgi:microcystin-dependent protein